MSDDQDLAERARIVRDERMAQTRPAAERHADTADDEQQDDKQSSGGEQGGDGGGDKPPPQKRRSRRGLFILAAVIVVLALGATWYWYSTRNLTSTDDAYTDGYSPSIAPRVAGQVTLLAVRDNQFVHKGDVLIQIDPRSFIAAVDQARAALADAQGQVASAKLAAEVAQKNFPAQLALAKAQLLSAQATLFKATADDRRQRSVPRAATTQQAIDDADAALMQARAGVAQAEAQVEQATPVKQNIGQSSSRVTQLNASLGEAQAQLETANLNLEWATVRAPSDGWVTKRGISVGDYVAPGQALLSLVLPQVWVTANVKETQLNRMRPGQCVRLSVDAYPGLKLTGHVDSVQLGSGSRFTAFPAENATGNFVKIVQRVPVKIDIDHGLDPNLPLPLGASVTPTVYLAGPCS